MTNYETLRASALEAIKAFIAIDDEYKSKKRNDVSKEATKANKELRKSLRYARNRKRHNNAVAISNLLDALDATHNSAMLTNASKFVAFALNSMREAQERETFKIARDDTLMSLLMRYDNFSMKKVMKFCSKHNIVFDKESKSFDFTNAVDVLDTIEEDDEDDDE